MIPEHRHPRRRDRSQEVEWIRALLHRGEACVLSAVLEGLPFALPRVYAYDHEREAVYLHGAHGGETGRMMEGGEASHGVPVTLTVFEVGRFLPGEEALEFGVEYASVVATGRARQVEDPKEEEHGLRLLLKKYAPHLREGEDYPAMTEEEILRTSVLRVDIESWSGKEKREPEDFPGAYRLEDVR